MTDIVWPRVSEITSLFFPGNFYDDVSGDRGTYYHNLIEECLKRHDRLKHFDIMKEEPFLEPLAAWLENEVVRVVHVEEEFVNRAIGYRGHPDAVLLGKTMGLFQTDWKTGKEETPAHQMQADAYEHFSIHGAPAPCFRFYIGHGDVRIKREPLPKYWPEFCVGVKMWQALQSIKNK